MVAEDEMVVVSDWGDESTLAGVLCEIWDVDAINEVSVATSLAAEPCDASSVDSLLSSLDAISFHVEKVISTQ
ncbi:hypothetical protein [Paraburkholderia saeva]|uniref:hypothetical protein n=1 Tax=Paraburkholderia saeva TaxID=2777537 RepID=UPI001E4CCC53|nr:hypothetical protein [Paraburkholderia saeva]